MTPDVLHIEMNTIEELWKQHLAAGYPSECRGEEIDGVDLVMLDADIAGCVSTCLGGNRLDHERTVILRKCAKELAMVLPKICVHGREYFMRLLEMTDLVLKKN